MVMDRKIQLQSLVRHIIPSEENAKVIGEFVKWYNYAGREKGT